MNKSNLAKTIIVKSIEKSVSSDVNATIATGYGIIQGLKKRSILEGGKSIIKATVVLAAVDVVYNLTRNLSHLLSDEEESEE